MDGLALAVMRSPFDRLFARQFAIDGRRSIRKNLAEALATATQLKFAVERWALPIFTAVLNTVELPVEGWAAIIASCPENAEEIAVNGGEVRAVIQKPLDTLRMFVAGIPERTCGAQWLALVELRRDIEVVVDVLRRAEWWRMIGGFSRTSSDRN
jgi:hypothetical protein